MHNYCHQLYGSDIPFTHQIF